MPNRPRIDLPNAPSLPEVRVPRPRRARLGPAQEKRAISATIKRITAGLRAADAQFYAVGKELLSLDRPRVVELFGAATFAEFLTEHVMRPATAYRYMAVAKAYPKGLALRLGVEKAYQLTRYAEVAKTRRTPKALAQRDAHIGTPPRPISKLDALDIRNLVSALKLSAARKEMPKVTKKETRAARRAADQVEELLGLDAKVRVDKARDVVRIEVSLSELIAE